MSGNSKRFQMEGDEEVPNMSLTSLIDDSDFHRTVKEMLNAGEETVVHLAVGGSSRVIKAI